MKIIFSAFNNSPFDNQPMELDVHHGQRKFLYIILNCIQIVYLEPTDEILDLLCKYSRNNLSYG